VADAIEALPDGEREALLLFAWEDLSYQSVAEALDLPIGTVRSRLNRARAHLRELLDPGRGNRVRSRCKFSRSCAWGRNGKTRRLRRPGHAGGRDGREGMPRATVRPGRSLMSAEPRLTR
jgi:hypothetical protein